MGGFLVSLKDVIYSERIFKIKSLLKEGIIIFDKTANVVEKKWRFFRAFKNDRGNTFWRCFTFWWHTWDDSYC